MTNQASNARISPEDLQNKLQSFQDGVQNRVDDKKNTLVTVGGVTVVVLILIFFLLGKRSGKKTTTLVEIRRI